MTEEQTIGAAAETPALLEALQVDAAAWSRETTWRRVARAVRTTLWFCSVILVLLIKGK